MKALWVMGWHDETNCSYVNARGAFTPPEELQKQNFPFVDGALLQVNAMNKNGWKGVIACGFWNMLNIFRVVILQDTAAEFIGMGHAGHAGFQHKVFQYQLYIE
jgi:hypothetical protein